MHNRVLRRMVTCAGCKYCVPKKGQKPGDLPQNECKRQPLHVFFTNATRICRYHHKMEWLRSMGINTDIL